MRWACHIVLISWLLGGSAHCLYTAEFVKALRVADGLIKVDGKPDSVWKEVGGRAYSQITFNDYGRIVLLGSDSLRNAPPEDHFAAPAAGSVTLLAAYDQSFLYFFFIVKENNAFNPAAGNCTLANLWKAHAVDVFVDPTAWSTSLYTAYFSADAGEVSYGTSAKSIEVSKPVWPGELREFYRDRLTANRFEVRSQPPTQLAAMSAARLPTDPLTLGVELKIPIAAADYAPGKSIFISWGYNHYRNPASSACDELPIAYRWAKHYKSYDDAYPKPPGWSVGDTTHYDPLQSYDGWGRFDLTANAPLDGKSCRSGMTDADWDLRSWADRCAQVATAGIRPMARFRLSQRNAPAWESGSGIMRDIRGRLAPGGSTRLFLIPAVTPLWMWKEGVLLPGY